MKCIKQNWKPGNKNDVDFIFWENEIKNRLISFQSVIFLFRFSSKKILHQVFAWDSFSIVNFPRKDGTTVISEQKRDKNIYVQKRNKKNYIRPKTRQTIFFWEKTEQKNFLCFFRISFFREIKIYVVFALKISYSVRCTYMYMYMYMWQMHEWFTCMLWIEASVTV